MIMGKWISRRDIQYTQTLLYQNKHETRWAKERKITEGVN